MKLKHKLLYLIIVLGGVGISIQGLRTLLNSVSFETTLTGLTLIVWGLAMTSHALWYWHFSRQYIATDTKPRPTLEIFNAWFKPIQRRVLNGLRYSFTGLALAWLLTKWFF